MPKYTVTDYFDVWGNPVDGYEVNNQSQGPDVMVRGEATDEQLVRTLIEAGALTKNALALFEDGELLVGDDGGDGIEITERETAWARVLDNGDHEYLEASDQYIQEGWGADQIAIAENLNEDEYELVVSHRPILGLHPQYNELDAKPFWRGLGNEAGERQKTTAVVELRAAPEKMEGTRRTPVKGHKSYGVLKVEAHIDGEYFGTFDFPDDFERHDLLGLSVAGVPVYADEEDVSEQIVALDAFMDRGGIGAPAFLKEPPYEARR